MSDPILIVDDEKDNLEALNRLLRPGYDVTTTDSPFEALKLIQTKTFHVIVSDQRMPEMTGVELLEKVKSVSPNVTRVLLTGYTDIESVIGAINRGNIYRYVAKPWDPEDFKLTLRQANESYVLRKELGEKNRALEKSNAKLKEAIEELTFLDKAKSRFLSLISHELNTPLTVLSAFVELLQEKEEELPEDLGKAISSIAKASHRFEEIVSDVLTFVNLESDSRLQFEEVDFGKLVVEVVKSLEGLRSQQQLGFKVSQKGACKLECDRSKIRVALKHFLKDAILRAKRGTEIKISMEHSKTGLRFLVTRSGEPISERSLEPLEASENPLNHHQNLGLSLAICRTIIERHGGEIELHHSDQTRTEVSLRIPDPVFS